MKALQLILLILITLTGCANGGPHVKANFKTAVANDSLKYLALGDSYTIGESIPTDQAFPFQLAKMLKINSFSISAPTIVATTGWTTDDLIDAISQSNSNAKKYDFVTLLVGVNDQFQQLSQSNYKVKFEKVLKTAIKFANGNAKRVFVLSIPDWGVTPYAGGQENIIGPQIDQFNIINREESKKAGVSYLDITGISRQAAKDPGLIAGDGLHPSAKMYQLWMQKLLPLIVTALKNH